MHGEVIREACATFDSGVVEPNYGDFYAYLPKQQYIHIASPSAPSTRSCGHATA